MQTKNIFLNKGNACKKIKKETFKFYTHRDFIASDIMLDKWSSEVKNEIKYLIAIR